MQNSKSVKTFNLATSLNGFNEQISKNVYSRLKIHTNLFDQATPERSKVIRFEQSRAFEYVGVKQLKAYYQRSRKMSKDKRRDTMPMSLGYSRHSVISNKDDQLFSKWQILEKVEGKEDQNIMVNDSSVSKFGFTRRQNTTVESSQFKQASNQLVINPVQNSGIIRMKNNYQSYKENWQKSQKKTELTKGFPSILRLATETRSMSIKKDLNSQHFKKQNINSRMWANVLREDKELRNIYDKSITKVVDNDETFTLNGRSKLQLQKQWINEKGDQGYRFQMIKKVNNKA